MKPINTYKVIIKIEKQYVAFNEDDARLEAEIEMSKIPQAVVDIESIKKVPAYGSGTINDQFEFSKQKKVQ